MKAHYTDPSDRFRDLTVFRHRPGDDPEQDTAIATGTGLGSRYGRQAWVIVTGLPHSDYVLAMANSGVSQESEWFAAREADLAGATPPRWRRLATVEDKVDLVPAIHGHFAYLAEFKNKPRREIVRIDLDAPGHTQVIVPEQRDVVRNMAGATDGLYVVYADPSGFRLQRIDYETAAASPFRCPFRVPWAIWRPIPRPQA